MTNEIKEICTKIEEILEILKSMLQKEDEYPVRNIYDEQNA